MPVAYSSIGDLAFSGALSSSATFGFSLVSPFFSPSDRSVHSPS